MAQMIISFTVSNYRSFKQEVTLSMMPSSRISPDAHNHEDHLSNNGAGPLRVGVIYGANGAGKSNLFKALSRLKNLVSNLTNAPWDPFMLPFQKTEPTVFDLIFDAKGLRFRYGVVESSSGILEEWFSKYAGGEHESPIFTRKTTREGTTEVCTHFSPDGNERLCALATIGVPSSRTFLANVISNLERKDYGELSAIIEWFDNLQLVSPSATVGSLARMLSRDGFRDFASEILRLASTGVENLEVEKKEYNEDYLKKILAEDIRDALKNGRIPSVRIKEGLELCYERKNGQDSFYTLTVSSFHNVKNSSNISMDIAEESDGTRRLLNLLPALYHMTSRTSVFFIDEIDRSMHPLLSRTFLEFFLNRCNESQLILTTHESNLLDLKLLRRDEIWFTEKDTSGTTHIYPLTEFRVRGDNIREHYLQGRFGAIPFLGNWDSFRQALAKEEKI